MANTVWVMEWEDHTTKHVHRELIGGFSNKDKGIRAAIAHAQWMINKMGLEFKSEWTHDYDSSSYWDLAVWHKDPHKVKELPNPTYFYSVRKVRVR